MRVRGSARDRVDGALTLRRHPSEVERGRRYVAEACAAYHRDLVETAMLLTSELITNALRYGTGAITLLVTPVDGAVRVDVADENPVPPRTRNAQWQDENGRGLLIVESLATAWGMETLPHGQGKSVWFTLRHRSGG